ncbi:HET-domain-containing protein, partial [Aaosphaeria arxii CBS 175.79]
RTHKYIAQSYTWGKSPRTRWIKVNDKEIRVANSLFDALTAFRRIGEDVILWVDALCINQADNKEKSHQITRMTEVYRNAEEVFVFLGRDSPHLTRPIMTEMKKADKQSSYPQMKRYLEKLEWKKFKDGLKDLLNREWFKRVWILQEVAFARTLRIFCGSQSVSDTCFVAAAEAADIDLKPHCRAIFEIMPRQHRTFHMGSQEQITSSWWSPEKTALADLLKLFGNREATQACDKVYALLSMSSDARDTDYLRPEYGKPDAEVVYDTAAFVV